MRAKFIRPEQYSLLHHSIKRRLVCRTERRPAPLRSGRDVTDGDACGAAKAVLWRTALLTFF